MMEERGAICPRCSIQCDNPDFFTIDHIIPRNMGFKEGWYRKPNNKQLLCSDCQRIKHALENAFRRKWESRKESYIILLNGFATPLEAITQMQNQGKDFNNIVYQ